MDELEYQHVFVNEFVNQLVRYDKYTRDTNSWYLYYDKRPGTPAERYNQDAQNFGGYLRRLKGKQ